MQRLVSFENPEAMPTPLLLLAELRTIDPTAELVYVGEGVWWLGCVRPNDQRAKRGQFILQFEARRDHPNKRNIFLGQLLQQGFARIEAYTGRDPAGTVTDSSGTPCTIVEDFRARDHAWRNDQGEQVVQERLAVSAGEEEKARADAEFKQYLATDGRAHFRREVRNRVSFGPLAVTGGGGSGLILSP